MKRKPVVGEHLIYRNAFGLVARVRIQWRRKRTCSILLLELWRPKKREWHAVPSSQQGYVIIKRKKGGGW